jgi:hypothetical protein
MQELITKLTEKAGLTPEQAAKAIETIKDFVTEKFPMLSGAVDNMFASTQTDIEPTKNDDPLSNMMAGKIG